MVSTVGIISYQGNPHVYPIFINEVAYYEKGHNKWFLLLALQTLLKA
jgi:hypothetical protein